MDAVRARAAQNLVQLYYQYRAAESVYGKRIRVAREEGNEHLVRGYLLELSLLRPLKNKLFYIIRRMGLNIPV